MSTTNLATLTEDPESWKGSSLLSVTQITEAGLKFLCEISQSMRSLVQSEGGDDRLKHHVLATVFYEASTRTSCSFQTAVQRLGGTFIHVDGQGNSSAAKKKESLADTIRCLECYTNLTVLRHPQQGSVGKVIDSCMKPVLNAGDGVGEHPTQALLDVFTIYDELNLSSSNARPLTVVLLGDLKHGRTVHSLAKLLTTCGLWKERLELRYVAPEGLEMPEYICQACDIPGVHQERSPSLAEACKGADVLYVTRVQRERFASQADYEKVKGSYVVDGALMKEAPEKMIVMHPLPRVDEICTSVDKDPRAAYFRQMENGMYVRMALLALVMGKA